MSPRFAKSGCEYFIGDGRAGEDQRAAGDHGRSDGLGEEDEGPEHGEEGHQVGYG